MPIFRSSPTQKQPSYCPILALFFVMLLVALLTPVHAQTLTTLHTFSGGVDGAYPFASLVQGSDGNFYGTTGGGGNGDGTVFRITPGGTLTTLHTFVASVDGALPAASLVQGSDGNFYGTTNAGGGSNGYGTVFRITPGGTLTTLYTFLGGTDGRDPYASLIQGSDGNFYGTTYGGGNGNGYGNGTVFRITPSGTLTILHAFTDGIDGSFPYASLIQGSDGNFYGTTRYGGNSNGFGTVFRITPGGTLTTLHTFSSSDGAYPSAALVQGSDGNFYGTTDLGTIFRIIPDGTLTTIYRYTGGVDGGAATALIQGSDGNFYGATGEGGSGVGSYGNGTVFRITPGGTLITLHAFMGGMEGASPEASLVQGSDGNFYGTTYGGDNGYSGYFGYGTVFRLTLGSSQTSGDSSQTFDGKLQTFDGNAQYNRYNDETGKNTGVDLSDDHPQKTSPDKAVPINISPDEVISFDISATELTTLAAGKQACHGAVVDGATRIVLRYTASAPGMVQFSGTGGMPGDNLRPVDHTNPKNQLVAVPTQLLNGQNVALAIYRVAEAFEGEQSQKTMAFQANYISSDNKITQTTTAPLTLYRAPVLLVHGLWDNQDVWYKTHGPWASLFARKFDIHPLDYKGTNTAGFDVNQLLLFNDDNGHGINAIYRTYRSEGIAITKVDVVGHSMGGLIARKFASLPKYKAHENFDSGYIRRLITIGTPHFGSPLLSDIVELHSKKIGKYLDSAMDLLHRPYGAALENMRPGSKTLYDLGQTPIPCYAEAGNYSAQSFGDLENLYNLLLLFAFNLRYDGLPSVSGIDSFLFNGEDNDMAVPVSSQEGGLSASHYKITGFTNHLQETGSDTIGESVADLLTGPLTAFDTGFPQPPAPSNTSMIAAAHPAVLSRLAARDATAPFVNITAPTEEQVFLPGDTLTVTVTPKSGTTLSQVFIAAGTNTETIGSAFVNQAPFTATLTIPNDALGALPVTVLAQDTSGNVCQVTANAVIQTSAAVQSLAVMSAGADTTAPANSAVTFTSQNSTNQLTVLGTFSDDVARDVTLAVNGTQYVSSDPTVAKISADGLITALANGSTEITVTNGSATATENVFVNLATPQIISVSPEGALLGSATTLSLVGSDLGGATQLEFLLNGQPDPKIVASQLQPGNQGASLTATVTIDPAAALGIRTVVVTTPGGTSDPLAPADEVGFLVTDGSLAVSPRSGLAGTLVTISGLNLTGTTAVTFNGIAATFTVSGDTQITATVPAGAKTGPLTISTPSGVLAGDIFTILTHSYTAVAVSVGADGSSRLLWNKADGTAAVWKLNGQGQFTANVSYGPYAGWTAKSIATGKDNTTHVLWTNTDGTASVYLLNASNQQISQVQYGPYSGWTAKAITVAPDNTVRLLWANTNGTASLYRLDSTNHLVSQQQYGPYTGWSAKAVTVGADGLARLLWTNTNGTAALWRLNAQGKLQDQQQYGPYTGWTAQQVASAPDGTLRLVWQNTDNHIALWTVSSAGKLTSQFQYGPYSGFSETSLAVGTDGKPRLLWDNITGQAALWSLKSDGSFASNYSFGPY